MADKEEVVEASVSAPDSIWASSSVGARDVYFRLGIHPDWPRLHVAVVVDHTKTPGEVITAYVTDSYGGVAPGSMKYVRPRK